MRPTCFRAGYLDSDEYLWLLSASPACPASAQRHLRQVRDAPALLWSSVSIFYPLSLEMVSLKKVVCMPVYCLLLVLKVVKTPSSSEPEGWVLILPCRWNLLLLGTTVGKEEVFCSLPQSCKCKNRLKKLKTDFEDPLSLVHSCFQERRWFVSSLSKLCLVFLCLDVVGNIF